MLNQLAWTIVDAPGLEKRDLDLALRTAQRAVELTHEREVAILDTLARAYFEKGQIDQAIEWQGKAVAQADDPDMKKDLAETLAKYKAKK